MPQVFRYRLYPTKQQVTKLNKTLDLCRWVYNETLALRKIAWESEQKRISYYDSKRMIPIWKKDKPELKEVHAHVLQDITMRVDLAFQAFFRRVKAGEKAVIQDSKVKDGTTASLIPNLVSNWETAIYGFPKLEI